MGDHPALGVDHHRVTALPKSDRALDHANECGVEGADHQLTVVQRHDHVEYALVVFAHQIAEDDATRLAWRNRAQLFARRRGQWFLTDAGRGRQMESDDFVAVVDHRYIVEVERLEIPVDVDALLLGADFGCGHQKCQLDFADIARERRAEVFGDQQMLFGDRVDFLVQGAGLQPSGEQQYRNRRNQEKRQEQDVLQPVTLRFPAAFPAPEPARPRPRHSGRLSVRVRQCRRL